MKFFFIPGVIGLLLTFLVTGYSLHQQRQVAIHTARENLGEILAELRVEWSRSVVELEQTLNGFENYLELTEMLPEPNPSTLRRTMDSLVLNNPDMVSLVVTDGSGQVLYWTNSGPKPNLSDRDYFNFHTAALVDGISIGSPLPSIMSPGQWVFGASKAVRHPDGTLDKVLIAIIDTSRLFRLLESQRSDRYLALTVLSHHGEVYAHRPVLDKMVGSQHPQLLNIGQTGSKEDNYSAVVNVDGQKHLVLIYNLDCCQFYLRGEISLAEALEPSNQKVLFIASTGGLIALILLWQLMRLLYVFKQEKQLANRLLQASRQDPLTGFPLLSLEPNPTTEETDSSSGATLVIMAPDHFADFLQHHGEQAGDDLIRHCARTLEKVTPRNASPYRGPGSSFFLLLPETGREQALSSAEAIRTSLTTEPFSFDSNNVALTSSAGITLWDGHNLSLSAAAQRAVNALARARQNGGDQCCWLPEREVWLENKTV